MNFTDGEDKADKTKPHGEEFELPDSHHYLCCSLSTIPLERGMKPSKVGCLYLPFLILNE
jgi:hypothetical protein